MFLPYVYLVLVLFVKLVFFLYKELMFLLYVELILLYVELIFFLYVELVLLLSVELFFFLYVELVFLLYVEIVFVSSDNLCRVCILPVPSRVLSYHENEQGVFVCQAPNTLKSRPDICFSETGLIVPRHR